MPIQTPEEARCPTCGARQAWSDACRRCKCDLRLFRAATAAHERHRRHCLNLLNAGFPRAALEHAHCCRRLSPGDESQRLLAICHLLLGDWAEALAASERFGAGAGRSAN